MNFDLALDQMLFVSSQPEKGLAIRVVFRLYTLSAGMCILSNSNNADDLCLTANRPDQLQTKLNGLGEYARRKGLTIYTAKSEVLHFNSHGFPRPAFSVGGFFQTPRHGFL